MSDVELLRNSRLLAELPEADLQRLVETSSTVNLRSGELLMAEGSQPDAMFVILEGEFEVLRNVAGTEVLVNVCGPGELLGELGLVHGRPRSATVRARTAGAARRIAADALDRLVGHPRTARALLVAITERLDRDEVLLRQHERLASLGTMAAGLLHQINNPAAAVQRGVARLKALLPVATGAAAGLQALAGTAPVPTDSLARADAEEEVRAALAAADVARPWEAAAVIARLGIDVAELKAALGALPADARDTAVHELVRCVEARAVLDEIAAGAEYLSTIVSGVRPLAYASDGALTDVDVHASLDNAVVLLSHKVPPDVRVVRDFDPAPQHVQGWPADLAMVWNYLLDNALDAVPPGGSVVLRTRGGADRVVVDVENTGPTVPPEVLEHVFEPFFTTKPVGQGTGIGLWSAHAMVTQRHRGELTMTSADGVTRVRVVLPRHP